MTEANDTRLHNDIARALDLEPGPSRRVQREVFARIAAERAQVPGRGALVRLVDWLRAPSGPRWAQAALIALVAVQMGLLVSALRPPVPEVTSRAVTMQTTRLRVEFNPAATEAQIRALLATLHGRISDGPDANGRYVVELTDGDPNAVANALREARAMQDVVATLELATP